MNNRVKITEFAKTFPEYKHRIFANLLDRDKWKPAGNGQVEFTPGEAFGEYIRAINFLRGKTLLNSTAPEVSGDRLRLDESVLQDLGMSFETSSPKTRSKRDNSSLRG